MGKDGYGFDHRRVFAVQVRVLPDPLQMSGVVSKVACCVRVATQEKKVIPDNCSKLYAYWMLVAQLVRAWVAPSRRFESCLTYLNWRRGGDTHDLGGFKV
jgi:hypothetical protein